MINNDVYIGTCSTDMTLSAVHRGHHGHPDRSAATQPHMQQGATYCVLWHIPPVTTIKILSELLCHSRPSVGSELMG